MLESTDAGPRDVIHRFMTLVHEAQRRSAGAPIDINAILRDFMATLSEDNRRALARIEAAILEQDARCGPEPGRKNHHA